MSEGGGEGPPPACPRCGEAGVPIVYGLPGAELQRQAERGSVALGGCILVEGAPDWSCRVCGRRWRAAAPAPGRHPEPRYLDTHWRSDDGRFDLL